MRDYVGESVQCDTVQCDAVWCGVVRCGALRCSAVRYRVVHGGARSSGTVSDCRYTVRYGAVRWRELWAGGREGYPHLRSLGEDVHFVAAPCLREGKGWDGKGAGWDVGCGLGRMCEWGGGGG